jgi:hypothetical protein
LPTPTHHFSSFSFFHQNPPKQATEKDQTDPEKNDPQRRQKRPAHLPENNLAPTRPNHGSPSPAASSEAGSASAAAPVVLPLLGPSDLV